MMAFPPGAPARVWRFRFLSLAAQPARRAREHETDRASLSGAECLFEGKRIFVLLNMQ
jgi:hypothetical protein